MGTGSGNSIEGRMSLFRRNSRLRQSMTSEGGFGRAMSGLSALSIDWENMEDFDVNIDHSSHINNTNLSEPITKKNYSPANENIKNEEDNNTTSSNNVASNGMQSGCAMVRGGICDCGPTCACVGCPIHDKQAGSNDNILRSFPKRPSILRTKPIDSTNNTNCCNTAADTSTTPTGTNNSSSVSFKT